VAGKLKQTGQRLLITHANTCQPCANSNTHGCWVMVIW